MLDSRAQRILTDLLTLPTAPFAEHHVLGYVEAFLRERRELRWTRDDAGNVLIHFKRGGKKVRRPVCITAHLDHPGFVADRMIGPRRVRAFWRGWVPPELFVGAKMRFFQNDRWVRGKVASIRTAVKAGRKRVDTAVIDVTTPVAPGSVGMWDFPDPKIRGGRIYARGCDDLAGAAAILTCLDRLTRSRTPGEAYFLLTRAEEVGFIGAIAACRLGTIPKRCVVVNVETSSQLPNARQGDGPILRVGDKASLFDPGVAAWLGAVAARIAKRDKAFRFQRKLMDGGTCEASAFCRFGYEAAGVCVALGNYHNVDRENNVLAPEHIHLEDWANLVRWFEALAAADHPFVPGNPELAAWIADLEATYADLLAASVDAPA
ncbi:MAG: hypothetical protein FLDDKLPJ_00261 [Phycisphaerae bacterium]|nr:hypothetical protein [Phycisphaerae bacterium]